MRLSIPAVRLLALGAALALSLASCAKGATTAGSGRYKVADYHPLAVGNQWTYVGSAMGQPIERTVTITEVKDGYFVDDANGMLRADGSGLRDPKRYLLMEPVERGRTWSSIVSPSSTEHYSIADVGFTVTTPAGTFNDCVRVHATNRLDRDKEMRSDWTYAPGVGIVRFATSMKVGEREIPQVSFELKQFVRK